MPPCSTSDVGCESTKCDQNILEISEKLGKIEIETEEECTYNIEDDNDASSNNENNIKNNNDDEYTNDDEYNNDNEYNKYNDDNEYTNDDEYNNENDYKVNKTKDEETEKNPSNTNNLSICVKIKEKGPSKKEKINNNRLNPFLRNPTSGGQLIYNSDENTQFNNFEIPAFDNLTNDANADFSFNNLGSENIQQILFGTYENANHEAANHHESTIYNEHAINYENNAISPEININNNVNGNYSFDEQSLKINEYPYETVNDVQLLIEPNIPAVLDHFPQTSTNRAEQALSHYIDQNKKLKQLIWIWVNTQVESDLIATLREKVVSPRFTENDLNFIYAIIIRLMKKDCDVDGKRLLVEYFRGDGDVLFKIAVKGSFLLMDFVLEVYQHLGIDPNQGNILHQIVGCSHVDLSEILDGLLNKTFDNKPSLKMFDKNCVDSAGRTILMIVVRNISMDQGIFGINMKYLDVILRRIPAIDNVSRDGRNVFHDCVYNDDIVQKFFCYYDPAIIEDMMSRALLSGWEHFQQQNIH